MTSVPPSTLGLNLARLRRARKLSQEDLAELSGVHRVIIAKVESGKQEGVSIENLGALAMALGVTTAALTDPADASPVAHLVPELEASGLLAPPLSDEEREWLLSLPAVVWTGDRAPIAATLYHMVQARRSGAPRQS
jgi:transcriptional regulator with XRE-family HTH domain